MIVIIDYGMGNLRSVEKALEKVGAEVAVSRDPDDLRQADRIVLRAGRQIERNLPDYAELDPLMS